MVQVGALTKKKKSCLLIISPDEASAATILCPVGILLSWSRSSLWFITLAVI